MDHPHVHPLHAVGNTRDRGGLLTSCNGAPPHLEHLGNKAGT